MYECFILALLMNHVALHVKVFVKIRIPGKMFCLKISRIHCLVISYLEIPQQVLRFLEIFQDVSRNLKRKNLSFNISRDFGKARFLISEYSKCFVCQIFLSLNFKSLSCLVKNILSNSFHFYVSIQNRILIKFN